MLVLNILQYKQCLCIWHFQNVMHNVYIYIYIIYIIVYTIQRPKEVGNDRQKYPFHNL